MPLEVRTEPVARRYWNLDWEAGPALRGYVVIELGHECLGCRREGLRRQRIVRLGGNVLQVRFLVPVEL
jgi:hypothetical protein